MCADPGAATVITNLVLRTLAAVAVLVLFIPGAGRHEPERDPHGVLRADSIGGVRLGMLPREVEEHFGKPDATSTITYGDNEDDAGAKAPRWTWHLTTGTLVLDFAPTPQIDPLIALFKRRPGVLNAYCTTSPELATAMGFRATRITGSAVVKVASRAGARTGLAPDPRPRGQRRNVLLAGGAPGTTYPAPLATHHHHNHSGRCSRCFSSPLALGRSLATPSTPSTT